jgi:hypothetical protein
MVQSEGRFFVRIQPIYASKRPNPTSKAGSKGAPGLKLIRYYRRHFHPLH